jgi:hypothetical protein
MSEAYYNYGKEVSREEFEKERELIIAKRLKEAENEENLIDDEDLEYYLENSDKVSHPCRIKLSSVNEVLKIVSFVV